MNKRYTVDELRKLSDEKLIDILKRASKADLNGMFNSYSSRQEEITDKFINECRDKVNDAKVWSWRLPGALSIELVLSDNPTWDEVHEYADTYMSEIDPIGKCIGYSSLMLIDYLKEHFHAPVPKDN